MRCEDRNENSLANWIFTQRQAKHILDKRKPCNNKMTAKRVMVLESISWWVWDVYEASWESYFAKVKEFAEQNGEIPFQSHPTLGEWINNQRMAYRAWQAELNGEKENYANVTNIMNKDRANKLESLPCWTWEPSEDA